MIEKFDTFIYNKHAPLDNKVAEDIQKNPEHFHVPSKLTGKPEKKKIERIFRDKAELPITSSRVLTVLAEGEPNEVIWIFNNC